MPDKTQRDMKTILQISPVMPVLVIDALEDVVPLATALYKGGLRVIEITLRTEVALAAIQLVKKALPDVLVGTGSVTNTALFDDSVEAGADFIVSPGYTVALIERAREKNIPFLPGASTPAEVMQLLEYGMEAMKFFPAEVSGGVSMLKAIAGPMPSAVFCPTGGIELGNASAYLALPNVYCIGGSWLASKDLVTKKAWPTIESLAADAVTLTSRSVFGI